MVQRSSASGCSPSPSTKAYAAVSVLTQLACRVERVRPVPASAFRPQPRVESSFLSFVRRDAPEAPDPPSTPPCSHLVRLAFGQRRKTLVNSLGGAAQRGATLSRDDVRAALGALGWASGAAGGAHAAAVEDVRRRARRLRGRAATGREEVAMSTTGDARRSRVEVAAPAKLNLALLVGPVRPDGFHEIASLMLPVTLADRVVVSARRAPGWTSSATSPPAPTTSPPSWCASWASGSAARFEVRVTIEKRVPPGGGLGGGSSDAAATLLAVERLFSLDLSPRLRYDVAAAVGSDVPFFLWPGPQLAMGRGQVLKEVALPALHLVVAMPDIGLSTAAVYRWRDEDARWQVTARLARGCVGRLAIAASRPPRRPRTWRPWWPTTSSRASSRARTRSARCSSACAPRERSPPR